MFSVRGNFFKKIGGYAFSSFNLKDTHIVDLKFNCSGEGSKSLRLPVPELKKSKIMYYLSREITPYKG